MSQISLKIISFYYGVKIGKINCFESVFKIVFGEAFFLQNVLHLLNCSNLMLMILIMSLIVSFHQVIQYLFQHKFRTAIMDFTDN